MPAADSTSRFSNRVKDYIAHRPSYPTAALHHIDTIFALRSNATIADIGSGTGILSAQLLSHLAHKNVHVIGIEPNAEMRAAGDELLAEYIEAGRFSSRDGTAEDTGLADRTVDLVVAGQAFHWFDVPRARAECARVLRDSGHGGGQPGVALVWNDRRGVDAAEVVVGTTNTKKDNDKEDDAGDGKEKKAPFPNLDSPIMNAYDLLLVQRGTQYQQVSHQHQLGEESFKEFYGPEGFELATFENPYRMDFEQLRGRLLSSSYTPTEGEEGHEAMMEDLRRLFERYQRGGKVDFVYDTRVFTGVIS